MGVGQGPREKWDPQGWGERAGKLSRKMEGLRCGADREDRECAALCVWGCGLKLPRAFPARLPSPPPPAR